MQRNITGACTYMFVNHIRDIKSAVRQGGHAVVQRGSRVYLYIFRLSSSVGCRAVESKAARDAGGRVCKEP